MKRNFLYSIAIILLAALPMCGFAQMVGTNVFLQGKYLEVGSQFNGSLGAPNAPSGYHPHSGGASMCGAGNALAHVFDYGYDGWTTGSPPYMGDYTLPGSPWEGWAIEVAGTASFANSTTCGFTGGTLTGSWTSYSNIAGRIIGNWSGTAGPSGALSISQEYRVDTLSSCLVITVVLKNTSSSTLTGVYYMRSCDPDNSESWGGSFATLNTIVYQNDFYHRVMVTATATGASSGTPPQPLSLCTKDCRAKALIFTSWPLSTSCLLSNIWSGSYSCVSTAYTTVNSSITSDIAIGIVYNCCDIPAGDSTTISYAYVYNGSGGVDNAFPNPQLEVNGADYDSSATVTACTSGVTDTLPVSLIHADDKNWKWSEWTWAPATGLTSTTGTTSSVIISSLSGTTTYTITGSDTTRGCGTCNHKVFYLTVIPATFTAPVVSDVYYCQGDYAVPLTAIGVNLQWYTSATGGTASTTAPTPSTSTGGVTTWWVSQKPCPPTESPRVPITVYVTPQPTLVAANNGPLCAGDTLRLFAVDTFTTGSISYSWSGPGGFSSGLQDPIIIPATIADSGMYSVTLTVNTCVSSPMNTMVVVHSTPPAPTVSPVTYCQYATSVPLTATGVNLQWYYPSTTPVTTPTPSTAGAGIFHYFVTQTTNGCVSPQADLVVTVNPKPSMPTVGNPSYCQYETATPLAAGGTSLLWYGPGISGSTSTAPTPNTSSPAIDTYYVTQTLLGCVSDPAPDVVTIKPKPSPPVVADTSYCQYSTAPALTATGTNLQWYTTPTGGTPSTTAPVPNTSTVGSTTWYVSQTISNCESDRAPITVTILYLPSFSIGQSRSYVCRFDTMSFSYSGPSLTGSIFTWYIPNGASYVMGSAADSAITVRFDSLYFQNVVLAASSYFGRCTVLDTISINVVYQPTALAFINENICEGDTVTLALSSRSSNADHFVWDFDGATIVTASSSSGGPYRVSYLDSGIHILKLQAFSVEGCPGVIVSDTFRVHPAPDAMIVTDGLSRIICAEDSVWLRCHSDNDGNRYEWAPDHFFHNNNHSAIWGRIEISGFVTLTVTDAFGCKASDSVLFTPESCCTVAFPLGFTPNGDGRNDVFRPLFQGYHRFHDFRIVNRWGQTVYESTNSATAQWDGTFNGVPQDMGVYYYFITYDCDDNDNGGSKRHTEKGEVTLIR